MYLYKRFFKWSSTTFQLIPSPCWTHPPPAQPSLPSDPSSSKEIWRGNSVSLHFLLALFRLLSQTSVCLSGWVSQCCYSLETFPKTPLPAITNILQLWLMCRVVSERTLAPLVRKLSKVWIFFLLQFLPLACHSVLWSSWDPKPWRKLLWQPYHCRSSSLKLKNCCSLSSSVPLELEEIPAASANTADLRSSNGERNN